MFIFLICNHAWSWNVIPGYFETKLKRGLKKIKICFKKIELAVSQLEFLRFWQSFSKAQSPKKFFFKISIFSYLLNFFCTFIAA